MSLRDTIEGARREAAENAGAMGGRQQEEETPAERTGFSRKSAAASRPTREAAASVRTVSGRSGGSTSSGREKSKEERRAERRAERDREDLRSQGVNAIMHADPVYERSERVWWVLLGLGFALAVASLVIAYRIEGASDLSTTAGMISLVTLIAAYAFIIGGFVYDLVRRRPIRKAAEERVRGMTDKKVLDIVAADRAGRRATKSK